MINVLDYGPSGQGSTIQAAINANGGLPLYVPAGTWTIGVTLTYSPVYSSFYTPGLVLVGDGAGQTILKSTVANGPLLALDVQVGNQNTAAFQRGAALKHMTLLGSGGVAGQDGLSLHRVHWCLLDDLIIQGFSGTGVHVPVTIGDADGPSQLRISRCYINACGLWGVWIDAGSGVAESSFATISDTQIVQCGRASAAYPPSSGGVFWKGLSGRIVNSAINQTIGPVGLYVYGASGLSRILRVSGTDFENNAGIHTLISGIDICQFDCCSWLSNSVFLATNGVLLDASAFLVRGAVFRGSFFRIDQASSPFTAFDVLGGNCQYPRIENTSWAVFDAPGQVRFGVGLLRSALHPQIEDLGVKLGERRSNNVYTTTRTSDSYTPDSTYHEIHRINVSSGTRTLSIGAPITGAGAQGKRLTLDIFNNSGGPITVNMNSLFVPNSAAVPPAGKHVVADFWFTTEGWVQTVPWSFK